jgi:hypothetical protein
MTVPIRKTLEMMGKAPGMCAITRESFLMQAHILLRVAGLDSFEVYNRLQKIGKPLDMPPNVVPVDMLLLRIKIPEDPWAQEVIKEALAMLPDGEFEVVKVE